MFTTFVSLLSYDADLVLPAAGGAEKEGTFINSERRLGLVQRVHRAPGQALADFHVVRLLAEAWGCGDLLPHWTSPEAVFRDLRELTRGQPCDLTGVAGYEQVDAAGGIQWPWTEADAADPSRATTDGAPLPGEQERRLFADGVFPTPDGRARFHAVEHRGPAEVVDADFPVHLTTGRVLAQYQSGAQTRRIGDLPDDGAFAEMHPLLASRLGVADGMPVTVTTRRGEMRIPARVTTTIRPDTVFVPFHWLGVNRLVNDALDPASRMPEFKVCAARVVAA